MVGRTKSFVNRVKARNPEIIFTRCRCQELKVFLTNERCEDAKLLASDEWCARLAYMSDIFQHLNELITRMQG